MITDLLLLTLEVMRFEFRRRWALGCRIGELNKWQAVLVTWVVIWVVIWVVMGCCTSEMGAAEASPVLHPTAPQGRGSMPPLSPSYPKPADFLNGFSSETIEHEKPQDYKSPNL